MDELPPTPWKVDGWQYLPRRWIEDSRGLFVARDVGREAAIHVVRSANAAAALGVSRRTVQLLLRDRKLGCHRLGAKGGKVSISQAHLDAYLARVETAPPAPKTGGSGIPDVIGIWEASRATNGGRR